ncbi:MAG: 5-amino-6-(D-ribitylamino)uracil--L-tyrosine 4-hydroxyphenyl transferase CofH [Acidobacteria bacterium]|nr:5-amino-6-(D-ribitylamino)uracil--L-tyrosine 4-hydroxyphenyl transferase CofH [Acidobacteriota bacterium]
MSQKDRSDLLPPYEESLEELLRLSRPAVAQVLEDSLADREITREEACRLADLQTPELKALVRVADLLRQREVGDVITYVVNRNINFTNICFVGCRFCAFSRGPRDEDAYFHSLETMGKKALEAWEMGATEVCVQGGLPRGLPAGYYKQILLEIKKWTPEMHIHAFSPMEVKYGVELRRIPLRDYLLELKEAGLGSLPGTAAEILNDEVRQTISRNKLSTREWIEIITTAHRLGIPSTSTLMYGHLERFEHWVDQLLLLRSIQKETGGLTEFVPLGFIHHHTDLYRMGLSRPGPTVEEHLKIHAVARLLLNGWVRHIQIAWVKLGEELSQACLQAGADDYSGTLIEENISRMAGATEGQFLSPVEMHRRIRKLGRIPAQRSTTYEILRYDPPDDWPATQPDAALARLL